jgi:hypothetical protein
VVRHPGYEGLIEFGTFKNRIGEARAAS